jgi:hypothetical protein
MASDTLRNGNQRGTRPKFATALTQAKNIQTLACDVALSLRQDLAESPDRKSRKEVAIALRMAVAAWDIARDAVRIARNRPLPGSLRHAEAPRQLKGKVAKGPSTFTEIAPIPPSEEKSKKEDGAVPQ